LEKDNYLYCHHLWANCLDNVRSLTSHNPIGLRGQLWGSLYFLLFFLQVLICSFFYLYIYIYICIRWCLSQYFILYGVKILFVYIELGTLYLQELTLTSLTSGGRSVGIVRSRTQTSESFFSILNYSNVFCTLQSWGRAKCLLRSQIKVPSKKPNTLVI
jgi:hypothetical protein